WSDMTAKECFRRIAQAESSISAKKQRVSALKNLAASGGSPNFSGMPKNPSKSLSPMADAVCKALDLEAEINKDELALQEKKVFLLELIGSIESGDYQTVLIKRYFEHLSWENIASQMLYSIRWIYKLHGRALAEMDKKLNSSAEQSKVCS
ncbi:MAG: hypothetical protein RR989_09645, partial [Ruthenibacterium sp.]